MGEDVLRSPETVPEARAMSGDRGGREFLSSPGSRSPNGSARRDAKTGSDPLFEIDESDFSELEDETFTLALARFDFLSVFFLRFLEGVSTMGPSSGGEPGPSSDSEDREPRMEAIKVDSV